MEPLQIAAALTSALLHAGWNAAVKASAHPREVMAAQMLIGAVLVLPALAWTGLPASASWIWLGLSTMVNIATVMALLRAYEIVGFGAAYPVVRALSVLVVVPLAALIAGERPSLAGMAGIGLICASLLVLALGHARGGALPRAALGWIAAAGIGTAAYVLCDAQGVRRAGSPLAYGFAVAVTNALAMGWVQYPAGKPWRLMRDHVAVALPVAVASMVSYLLILWVWSRAPVAPAAALRDTSAVFALIIAILWLKEPVTPLRLFALLLSVAAVPLLRLA